MPVNSTEKPAAAAEQVVNHVRGLIENGNLRSGDRLPAERELARELGVSRPSVRSGLKTLAAMGVVQIRQGAGTFITAGPPVLGSEPLSFLAALHGFTRAQMFEARLVLEVTVAGLAEVRYTLNTVDEFYLAEKGYYDEITPSVRSWQLQYAAAMLESPFRKELEKALIPQLFRFYECQVKAMSPIIVDDMVEENRLITEYSRLMAGMTFDFQGKQMPLSLLRRYMQDDDRDVRRQAYDTLGRTLQSHAQALDSIYDSLVKVRDRMAKKMGVRELCGTRLLPYESAEL
jgi:DNA-binding transcriptional regulator YhcF (GntR family)